MDIQQFKQELLAQGYDPELVEAMVMSRQQPAQQQPVQSDYQIQKGDTLSGIAEQTGSSVEELASANQIADPDMIYAGDTLKTKAQGESPTDFSMTQDRSSEGRMIDTDVFKINQEFGNYNPKLELSKSGKNYGVDFNAKTGDKVFLPSEGEWEIVESYAGSGFNDGYGKSVKAKNSMTGEILRFSHLSKNYAKPGQVIPGGQLIGAVGSTGNVTGPHLDLEMIDPSGSYVDVTRSRYGQYLF